MPLRPNNPAVIAVLRRLGDESDHHIARGQQLSPPYGTIPVGGAHIGELARGWALRTLIRGLCSGAAPAVALGEAQAEARLWYEKWNRSRKDYQVHRWVGGLDDVLGLALRRVVRANDGIRRII